jgi:hypothetical protein
MLSLVTLASTVALMAGQPAGPMPNAAVPQTVAPGAPAARPLPKPENMTAEERRQRNADKAAHQQAKAARKAQTDANKAAPHPPY